mgnify:CR=1 FL=1
MDRMKGSPFRASREAWPSVRRWASASPTCGAQQVVRKNRSSAHAVPQGSERARHLHTRRTPRRGSQCETLGSIRFLRSGSRATMILRPRTQVTTPLSSLRAAWRSSFTPGWAKSLEDGDLVRLRAGQTGFIKGGRIHDARYITKCKLVYVHNSPFAFNHEQ